AVQLQREQVPILAALSGVTASGQGFKPPNSSYHCPGTREALTQRDCPTAPIMNALQRWRARYVLSKPHNPFRLAESIPETMHHGNRGFQVRTIGSRERYTPAASQALLVFLLG